MQCPPGGPPPLVTVTDIFPVTTLGPAGMLAIPSATLGEAMQNAIKYAAMRQKQMLDAEALAEVLAVSQRTLSRKLQAEGTTLQQLRAEVSIEYVELLLLDTEKSIAQIAHAVGFADAAAFTHAFKRTTGRKSSDCRTGAAPDAVKPGSTS